MSEKSQRDKIATALSEMGVDFPATATLCQLRGLLAATVGAQRQQRGETSDLQAAETTPIAGADENNGSPKTPLITEFFSFLQTMDKVQRQHQCKASSITA